ncbi:MAG: hypothetical protein QG568_186 [Patescibacteria group bacterium]|nr:hypothetical protein [Patescibacteria group bacterium]
MHEIISRLKITLRYIVVVLLTLIFFVIIIYTILGIFTSPSNTRDWSVDQSLLPYAEISTTTSNLIHVKNIRNYTYKSTSEYTPNYYDKTFDISKLKKVYYIVEPFTGFKGSAHTFLSFEFESAESTQTSSTTSPTVSNDFLTVSVEIRKEKGESFSALKGLFNQYEIMYVLADERDAIKLRSNFRKDDVYVYPIKTTKEKASALFLNIIERVNTLHKIPEFYNTAYNTCTTNIMRHANTITPSKIPFSYKVLLPAYSDELAFDLGMIDTTAKSLEEARLKYKINEKALLYADDVDFSNKIRE